MMDNLSMKPQMSTRDLCTLSQNWIQIKNISVKRTSGVQRYYQKIVKELDGYELKSNPTGENIMDLVKNFKYSLNSEGKIVTKERS
jgi:Mor family transcriptional regulator